MNKEIVENANTTRCTRSIHRGPLQPYPPFNDREKVEAEFVKVRDEQTLLFEELVCFHTRDTVLDGSLGIGVSLTRLPRTGEIRTVTPSLDLLSLKAFTKQNVRKSLDGVKFTHWLPLYFGEQKPFERKWQVYDDK